MKKAVTKIICTLLIVSVLSVSVGTKYFDSNHMEKVDAVGTVVVAGGITLATIFEFCLFVGATALSAYGIYEGYENREEIARFGKEFIDSCSENVDGWIAQIVDTNGQDYVFGSEALKLVQDTEWSVIQGGLPPEGDPNKKDDKDKDKFHIPGDPMTHVAQFTALGATWFTTNARGIYQDWCDILDGWTDKDTPIPSNNVLANNFPQSVAAVDIEAQWSGSPVTYTAKGIETLNIKNAKGDPFTNQSINDYSGVFSTPIAGSLVTTIDTQFNRKDIVFRIWIKSGSSIFTQYLDAKFQNYSNGKLISSGSVESYGFSSIGNINANSDTSYIFSSLTVNASFPVFTSVEAAKNYLLTGEGYEDALNYGRDYRVADWLKQDWAGTLIDPLINIGLTLSQMIQLCNQLGLKTAQGIDAQQLLELLKNSLPKLNPDILPGESPTPTVVDPALDPIYYPDPDAHPDKPPLPVIDPSPVQKPDPVPTPTPTPIPTPSPDPDPMDIPIDDVVPTVDSSFGDIAGSIRYKFPFSIPWDLHHLFKKMANTPKAPYFELPIVLERYGIYEKIIVDMSPFQKLSDMSRTLFSLIFVLGLIKLTMLVVGMRKEE